MKRKVLTQKHFEVYLTGRNREETRYDVLTDDEDCRLLLMACRHAVGPTFDNRNVALRLAVLNLMNARFGLSRNQFRKALRRLREADVVEMVVSHSVQALRLTETACERLKG
ncbi:MAG: hypothetical protein NXI04_27645 [Planctomycetaceae bacterium]|nr:hypothetical protein [Planctomycetaceae bacterium]